MSLGELARRSGLSKQTLSKIEQGVGNPTVETLSLLGAALDIPARRLLTEWGTPVFVQRQHEGEWVDEGDWSERLLDEVYGSGYVRTLVLRLERSRRWSTPTLRALSTTSMSSPGNFGRGRSVSRSTWHLVTS
jgi:transcriptional regulator with XRE-family HTH domain